MDDFIHLVRDAQDGSSEAFGLLVARFQDMAYTYAFAILNDFDLAQDAVQEAFVEAYQVLPYLRAPLAFPAWLKRIIFKQCDRIRRRKQPLYLPLSVLEAIVLPQPGPPELVERREVTSQVSHALKAIPERLRAVAVLYYVRGYSQEEIGQFLGVPAKTVKSRLHASRIKLRERMLTMVQNEFEENLLPEHFTGQTVEQAVRRAEQLNQAEKFGEAEDLLRFWLQKAPEHPDVLKALNRAVMRGRVYGLGRWGLLQELASQGKTILKTSVDEEVHRQVARTLLAIPAMVEAISFLEDWLGAKGPNLERLGMLAWAKSCSGDFNAGIQVWDRLVAHARTQSEEEVLAKLPFIAYTLVDALADAAGRNVGAAPAVLLTGAQEIARQAWQICGHLGPLSAQETFSGDSDWLLIRQQAKMDASEIAPVLLERHPESADLSEQAARLAIRGWLEPAESAVSAWERWARACVDAGDCVVLGKFRRGMLMPLRMRGLWREANQLAGKVWETLGDDLSSESQPIRSTWDWERFNPVPAIDDRDWESALALVQEEIQERGVQGSVGWAAIVAGGSGTPTPSEIVRALDANGVDQVDEYGMFGWYILAREAGHGGAVDPAIDALRKALLYRSNKPYWITDLWEQDVYWGDLQTQPAFHLAFEQRRQRIGPVYGWLHYLPGW